MGELKGCAAPVWLCQKHCPLACGITLTLFDTLAVGLLVVILLLLVLVPVPVLLLVPVPVLVLLMLVLMVLLVWSE